MKTIGKAAWLLVLIWLLVSIVFPAQPARAATGFHISGRNLLDANGNNFIMRGISHAHVWYPNETSSFANIKAAGANTIRVVLGGGRWGPNSAADVANVIQLCKTNKLICVLEDHDTTGYGEDGAATSLAQAVSYWQSIQSVLTGQEAYVIINIGNEPYGNNNATAWVDATKNAIIAMRNAGFRHTLMVDAPNWGQDWQFVMRDNAASIFNSDVDKNTIFSIHMYGVFDTAAEIQSYVSSFVSAGLPLVIGEFGWNHSDGNPDEDTIMATAQSSGIGYIGWSWSGNGGGVEYLDMVTGFNPSQRTSWGTRIITGANGLQQTSVEASVYNIGPTPTRTPTLATDAVTPTRTPTRPPTMTFTPSSGMLRVQLVGAGTDNNQQTAFHYRVQNTGSSPASNISVRIYFSPDGSNTASSYVLEKYYDQSGVATVSGPTQSIGNNYYFTINYGTASLPAGGAWEYHTSLHLNNWGSTYNGANDWWHTTGTLPASYTDWTMIPAYISGARVWGSDPIPGIPDLVVASIAWSPASPQLGNTILFSAVVRNIGLDPSPAGVIHDVCFTVTSGLTPPLQICSTTSTASIPPGGSATLQADQTWLFNVDTNYTVTAAVDAGQRITEENETNNTLSRALNIKSTPTPTHITVTPTFTPTPTRTTVTPTFTPTPTRTAVTPTFTPTATFTPRVDVCSPVTGTITAPFPYDGPGTFCWQTSNLGSYINSWNLQSLTINGVDFSNKWVPSSSYPAKINGFWYVSYVGNYPWSHFEAK